MWWSQPSLEYGKEKFTSRAAHTIDSTKNPLKSNSVSIIESINETRKSKNEGKFNMILIY